MARECRWSLPLLRLSNGATEAQTLHHPKARQRPPDRLPQPDAFVSERADDQEGEGAGHSYRGWMKKNLTGDTHGKPLFDEFGLNIIREKATPVSKFDEITAVFLENRFFAKVLARVEDKSVCLEFPVNHMNVKRETRQWQVETGPILIPVMGGNGGAFDYLPAFVHFNSFDKMDIFYDYPFGYRSLDLLNKGVFSSAPCNIKLFA